MIEISENIFYFPGAVNMMFIKHSTAGIMIDGGLDEQRMKKVVKEIEERGWRVTHLILTHAHADHFGGVSWLQKNFKVYTYAPKIEASIMASPVLEPIYLFGGASPLSELRNKFLEASPVLVDEIVEEGQLSIAGLQLDLHSLPGHSYHQIGVGILDRVLYAADGYFSIEILEKHGVPFIVDAEQVLTSLEKIKTLTQYTYYLPGHGNVEQDITHTIQANINRHIEILTIIESFVKSKNQVLLEEIMENVLTHFQLQSSELGRWLLYRTAILGYIRTLIDRRILSYQIKNHKLFFSR